MKNLLIIRKYEDSSDIVGSAIYTYKGSAGKDKRFIYKLHDLQDDSLSEKFKEIKDSAGGVLKMSIDEIREKYLEEKGSEQRAIDMAKEMLKDNEPIEKIMKYTKLSREEIIEIKI
ncbi:MAG: hypothetical protein ACRC7N_09120 [Clostridium sp.]